MTRVLVVATGRKTRGGITSVIKAHEVGSQWKKNHCVWVQTHRDGTFIVKLWYLCTAIIRFLALVPFCDIVHFHFSECSSAKRKSYFLPIAKILGKKVISHFHSFSLDTTIRSQNRHLYEYLFNKSDIILVLSEYWKKSLVDELGINENKVRVLYNPCPVVNISKMQMSKLTSERIINKEILYAGTVYHRKGYDDLIRAFAKIAFMHKDWKIVFAGNGEIEEGIKLASELGIDDRIKFLGWVSGQEKHKAFMSATIFCLPSYAEGFPMSVLDAWAYGLPVVTTPVGGLPDVAIDGENMLLFNPGDIDALARQLEKMIVDEELRNCIALASIDFAEHKFNLNTINKQLGALYEELSK